MQPQIRYRLHNTTIAVSQSLQHISHAEEAGEFATANTFRQFSHLKHKTGYAATTSIQTSTHRVYGSVASYRSTSATMKRQESLLSRWEGTHRLWSRQGFCFSHRASLAATFRSQKLTHTTGSTVGSPGSYYTSATVKRHSLKHGDPAGRTRKVCNTQHARHRSLHRKHGTLATGKRQDLILKTVFDPSGTAVPKDSPISIN